MTFAIVERMSAAGSNRTRYPFGSSIRSLARRTRPPSRSSQRAFTVAGPSVHAIGRFVTAGSLVLRDQLDVLQSTGSAHEPELSGPRLAGAVPAAVLGAGAARFDDAFPQRFPGAKDADAGVAGGQTVLPGERLHG